MITAMNIFFVVLNSFMSGFNYACWKDLKQKQNLYASQFSAFVAVFIFMMHFI